MYKINVLIYETDALRLFFVCVAIFRDLYHNLEFRAQCSLVIRRGDVI